MLEMIRRLSRAGWVLALTLVLGLGLALLAEAAPAKRSPGLIMLVTDFGSKGYLLGALKGSIYRANPEARIDSITNDIQKFDIDEAAQTLVLSTADYPAGTIFVVVVDPGLGKPRTPIALETVNGQLYLAPDNGVLTQVALRYGVKRIHRISSRDYILANPSESTFLSRDVFGPAAAALARDATIDLLGPTMDGLYLLTGSPAQIRDGQAFGTVRLIDGFGNVQTNINRDHLDKLGAKVGDVLEVVIGERHFDVKLVRTYGDVPGGERLALLGSHGDVQLAINQGSLARNLEVQKGEAVALKKK